MWLLRQAAIPAVLAVLGTVELVSLGPPRLAAAVAAELLACGLLVWRRRWTLTVCTTAGLVLIMLPYVGPELDEPAVPILIVGLGSFSLARWLARQRGLLGMAVIFVALSVTQQITLAPPPDVADVMFLLAILAPPYVFGWLMRRLDDSHTVQTRLLLQRQEADQREAVSAERARIARELHDVLAHSISAMVVQSEVASQLIPAAPQRAQVALQDVTTVGRAALAETGRLLALIRDSDDELGLAPDVGLDRLPDLVDGFRRSGLHVDLVVDGPLRSLPAAIDLSGYRIVQEALTNALKYATDQAVSVRISRTPSTLAIAATNRTAEPHRRPRGNPISGGLGLLGMRERVSVFGGSLSHGPSTDGMFELSATLPLSAGAS